MLLGAVDITEHLKVLFNVIYEVYKFLNSIEFIAFGYKFTLFGILFGFVFLVILIKALTFGFDTGVRDELKNMREENKEDKINEYSPRHEYKPALSYNPLHDYKSRHVYKPRHRRSTKIEKKVVGRSILRREKNYEKD